jgi:hypothetical protein
MAFAIQFTPTPVNRQASADSRADAIRHGQSSEPEQLCP